jgi:hypothetical protein
MSGQGLTNLVLALIHVVVGPRNHRRGHRGGRCHRRPILALAPPPPSLSSAPHRRVLERPRPLTLTDRWSPWTSTPLHGVVGAGCVPSTVGGRALIRLHRSMGLHHWAVRGRREKNKKKRKTSIASRWSPTP